MHILLLHPPQVKPAEPPAGIPLLAAALRTHGCTCTVCDLNIEALHALLAAEVTAEDTWSRRAEKHRHRHLKSLRDKSIYSRPASYTRAVADLNRHLENCGHAGGAQLSLANYQEPHRSPLRSEDLLDSARHYAENLYYAFFSQRLAALIEKNRPSHIGLSLNYLSQALCTFAILGFLKNSYPTLKLIIGGGLVTTWLQSPGWRNPFGSLIDHFMAGPGEHQLTELMTGSAATGRACPDYSDFHQYDYLSPGLILPYATSTGCFWRRCSFCPETSERNHYRPLAPSTVLAELDTLLQAHRPVLLHFLDNAISPAMLHALTLSPLPVPWYGFVRFTKDLADPEFCRHLRSSGCVLLKLGLESGSQQVLDRMAKGIDLQLAAQALAALNQAGIATYVYLLFGTPGEALAEARQTLEFVRAHHARITYLNLAIFNLPAGSAEVRELEVREFYEGDLSIYRDFNHPRGWNRREIRRFLDSEFKRDPAIHAILHNDPLHFTSNHAPFFPLKRPG